MKIRIHFEVGSTAMTKVVTIKEPFSRLANELTRHRVKDSTLSFTGDAPGKFVISARSIVLVEEVTE